MGCNEGPHDDNHSQCTGCLEWFDDQALTRELPSEDLLCLGCLQERRATRPTPPMIALYSTQIDLPEFVRAMFDGAIGDHDLPFVSQDAALLSIEWALRTRAGRPLNTSESVKVGMEVALEWNRRAQVAIEVAEFAAHGAA